MSEEWAVTSVAVPLVVATACAGDPEVLKSKYVQSGDEFVAQKKYPEAIVEYRNAIDQGGGCCVPATLRRINRCLT